MTIRDDLYALELALARRDAATLPGGYEAILHPDFTELGSSGRAWTRPEMIEELGGARYTDAVSIDDFRVEALAPDAWLAVYVTVGVRPGDGREVRSRRSSIWLRDGGRWRMRFHQGTPLPTTG